MKIGRNELCPCGSKKKYKKCCLDNSNPHIYNDDVDNFISRMNNVNSVFENTSYASFPGLKVKTKDIKSILKKYDFDDLVLSIFCINSWLTRFGCSARV